MAKLKVPSLQHLARLLGETPEKTKRALIRIAEHPPQFNYNPLDSGVRDHLVFQHPIEQVAEGIRRAVKREKVRENLLGVLPLVATYFAGVTPTFVQAVEPRYYPVGRGLVVPFRPPLIYGCAGQIYFPWFSYWRRYPLQGARLSLFVTIVDELLRDDPDLETADFKILDFSASGANQPRKLKVIDGRDVQRLSDVEKAGMLAIFAEGYTLAQAELARRVGITPEIRPEKGKDESTGDMFDPKRPSEP